MEEIGLYQAMQTLRAVRRLRPDPVPEAVLQRILEAASWAPTGGNVQPWRAIVVRDAERKKKLGALYQDGWNTYAKGHRAQLAKAPEALQAKQARMLDAGDYLGAHFGESPAVILFCFNPKLMAITDAKLDRISVVGGASIYTAVENLLLACRAEGLGCTLTTLLCGYEDEVREILEIPEPWGAACAVPVGSSRPEIAAPETPCSLPMKTTRCATCAPCCAASWPKRCLRKRCSSGIANTASRPNSSASWRISVSAESPSTPSTGGRGRTWWPPWRSSRNSAAAAALRRGPSSTARSTGA